MHSEKLTPQTVLRRVPNLTIKIESDNQLQIVCGGKTSRFSHRALCVLDLFARPQTLATAFEQLQPLARSAQDWIDLTSSVLQLHREGLLRDELEPHLIATSSGFDNAALHIRMLNDRDRTSRFLDAIHATVSPGDVVLDIGTGTGVLAVAAARAGARHVYAIEASSIGSVARTTFEANGFGDRISLVEGWSTQIELAEHADVLVSEIIGDEPLGEAMLETTLDARKRLLKPSGKLIPASIRILGLPAAIPEEILNQALFTKDAAETWQSWYGIQFAALAGISQKYPPSFKMKPRKLSAWKFLAEPILLAEIDLRHFTGTAIETRVSFVTDNSGTVSGFVFFFETELSEGNWLTTHPQKASADSSWRSVVQILPTPFDVVSGERLSVKYHYRGTEEFGFVAIEKEE